MFKGRTPKPFRATQIILGTWRSFGDVWITLGVHLDDIDMIALMVAFVSIYYALFGCVLDNVFQYNLQ